MTKLCCPDCGSVHPDYDFAAVDEDEDSNVCSLCGEHHESYDLYYTVGGDLVCRDCVSTLDEDQLAGSGEMY